MLQTHEMRLEHQTIATIMDLQNPLMANVAHRKFNNTSGLGNNQSQNRGRGNNNGYRGNNGGNNNNSYGRGNNRGSSRGNGRGNKLIYQFCGRTGHITVKCYHGFDISFQGLDQNVL